MKLLKFLKDKIYTLIVFSYLLFPSMLSSQGTDSGVGGSGLKPPTKFTDIKGLLDAILQLVVSIGTPIVAVAIIYAGFKFVIAQGNTEKINEAKRTILYVVIGAAIVLGAQVIKTVITGTVDSIKAGAS